MKYGFSLLWALIVLLSLSSHCLTISVESLDSKNPPSSSSRVDNPSTNQEAPSRKSSSNSKVEEKACEKSQTQESSLGSKEICSVDPPLIDEYQPSKAPTPLYVLNESNPYVEANCLNKGYDYASTSITMKVYLRKFKEWDRQQSYFKDRFQKYHHEQRETINYVAQPNVSVLYKKRFWDRYYNDPVAKRLWALPVTCGIFAVLAILWAFTLGRIKLRKVEAIEESFVSGLSVREGEKLVRKKGVLWKLEGVVLALMGLGAIGASAACAYYFQRVKSSSEQTTCNVATGVDMSDNGVNLRNGTFDGIVKITDIMKKILPHNAEFERALKLNQESQGFNIKELRTNMNASYLAFKKELQQTSQTYPGTKNPSTRVTSTFMKNFKIESHYPLEVENKLIYADSILLEDATNILAKVSQRQLSFVHYETNKYATALTTCRESMYRVYHNTVYSSQSKRFSSTKKAFSIILPVLTALLGLSWFIYTCLSLCKRPGKEVKKRDLICSKLHIMMAFLAAGTVLALPPIMYLMNIFIDYRCRMIDGLLTDSNFIDENYQVLFPPHTKVNSLATACIFRHGNNTLELDYMEKAAGILPLMRTVMDISNDIIKVLEFNWTQPAPALGSVLANNIKNHLNMSMLEADDPSDESILAATARVSNSYCALDQFRTSLCQEGYIKSTPKDTASTGLGKKYCMQVTSLPDSTNYEGRYTSANPPITCKVGTAAENEKNLVQLVKSSKYLSNKYTKLGPLYSTFYNDQLKLFQASKKVIRNTIDIIDIYAKGVDDFAKLNVTLWNRTNCGYVRDLALGLQNSMCSKLGITAWKMYWVGLSAGGLIALYGFCLCFGFRTQIKKPQDDFPDNNNCDLSDDYRSFGERSQASSVMRPRSRGVSRQKTMSVGGSSGRR